LPLLSPVKILTFSFESPCIVCSLGVWCCGHYAVQQRENIQLTATINISQWNTESWQRGPSKTDEWSSWIASVALKKCPV
jgi:hypothetical protein